MMKIEAGKEFFFSTEDGFTGEYGTVTVDIFKIDISASTHEDLKEVYENGVVRFYFGYRLPWFEFALFKHGYLPNGRLDFQIVVDVHDLSSIYQEYRNDYITIKPRECFGFAVVFKTRTKISSPVEIKIEMNGDCGFEDDDAKYIRSILTKISGE